MKGLFTPRVVVNLVVVGDVFVASAVLWLVSWDS